MSRSPIEWTDFSINPIRARDTRTGAIGHHCVKVSPGCKNCYASFRQHRFHLPEFQNQITPVSMGEIELFLDDNRLQQVLNRRKPTKWFWCDMTDMFGEWVPDEWLDKCFAVMALTPQHTHQVLTKRPERMCAYFNDPVHHQRFIANNNRQCAIYGCLSGVGSKSKSKGGFGLSEDHVAHAMTSLSYGNWPLTNVHLGISAEDQPTFNARVAELLKIPAAVHWVSLEPLLDYVNAECIQLVDEAMTLIEPLADRFIMDGMNEPRPLYRGGLDWVVAGLESGSFESARSRQSMTMGNPSYWLRALRDQCASARKPFFIKQITDRGKKVPFQRWPADLQIRQWPDHFINGEDHDN